MYYFIGQLAALLEDLCNIFHADARFTAHIDFSHTTAVIRVIRTRQKFLYIIPILGIIGIEYFVWSTAAVKIGRLLSRTKAEVGLFPLHCNFSAS